MHHQISSLGELFQKLRLFTEYYKYHNEIPRFFMPYLCEIMSKYSIHRHRSVIMIREEGLNIIGSRELSKRKIEITPINPKRP